MTKKILKGKWRGSTVVSAKYGKETVKKKSKLI
jgi:hypothetical protein